MSPTQLAEYNACTREVLAVAAACDARFPRKDVDVAEDILRYILAVDPQIDEVWVTEGDSPKYIYAMWRYSPEQRIPIMRYLSPLGRARVGAYREIAISR